MSKTKSYRWCFVPMCKNTTESAPSKVFVTVPRDEGIRKLWFRIARRTDEPTQSNYFCCEDHFDLKDEMENYMRYCLMGGPIKMKPGVVPHTFACQPNRKQTANCRPSLVSEEPRCKVEVADILAIAGCSSSPDTVLMKNRTSNISTASVRTQKQTLS